MILGILSDSHGRHERTARALRLLKDRGATAFVHCGDVGGEAVLAELAAGATDEFGHPQAWFVWGNTDLRDPLLDQFAVSLGLPLPPRTLPLKLTLANRRIAVFHGHEREFESLLRRLSRLPADGASPSPGARSTPDAAFNLDAHDLPEFVFYGHTHVARDETIAGARFINPGALQRAATYTAAVLDLSSGELRSVVIPSDGE